jgi:putative NADPH-quinone reductase
MKTLILNGSPKKERSDTLHLSTAFARGICAAGGEVETVHLYDAHIEYCTGCFACKHNGGVCVIEDDMAGLLQKMLETDVLICSFPLYSYAMPAAMKNFVDRTMPLSSWNMVRNAEGKYGHNMQFDVSRLHFVMICGCGFPNSRHNFEGAVRSFRLKYPDSTVITVPESPMFNIREAQQFTAPRLLEMEAAGREYAEGFSLSEQTLLSICSPMIPEEIYAQFANGMK